MDFKAQYSREEYIRFFSTLFGNGNFQKIDRSTPTQSGSFGESMYFRGIHTLGLVRELEGLDDGLIVLEIQHQSSRDARVGLTKELMKLLSSTEIEGTYRGNALVILTNPNDNTYRLSLFTTSYDKTQGYKKVLSNPRRQSFLLGQKKVHTPKEQLEKKGTIISFEDLKKRFSIEVVNKEFYKNISEFFYALTGGTFVKGKQTYTVEPVMFYPGVTNDKKKDELTRKEFGVRLFGRIMFCWFLKQKVLEDGNGLIPSSILSSSVAIGGKYYNDILEPLFFEILNKPHEDRKDSYKTNGWATIPYLNGGLFHPQEEDYFDKSPLEVYIPDDWFKQFFEFLELYNFTIDENTSIDQEMSVDPEMLGRIFENLLAEINPETGESARKSTGSFYTPREIVEYMVDESIIQYLLTQTEIKEDKVRALISYNLDDDQDFPLTTDDNEVVFKNILNLKIFDPACGSGAYPIGVLQKILYIMQTVDPDGNLWTSQKLSEISDPMQRDMMRKAYEKKDINYLRKLTIIRDIIYGCDIQSIAVETSKLRCFLTLIVDEKIDKNQENFGIEPLPNLEFKFVCANTLIPLDINMKSAINDDVGFGKGGKKRQMELFSNLTEQQDELDKLLAKRKEYFSSHHQRKQEIKKEIELIQSGILTLISRGGLTGDMTSEHIMEVNKIINWKMFEQKSADFFDLYWMYGIEDGFDIVIGNPPYVDIKQLDPILVAKFFKLYNTTENRINLYSIFIQKGFELLNEKGILSYINPNSMLLNSSYKKLRAYIIGYVIQLVKLPDNIFENATVETMLLFLNKGLNSNKVKTKFFKNTDKFTLPIKLDMIEKSDWNKDKDFRFNLFINGDQRILIDKIESLSKGNKLDRYFDFCLGITPYDKYQGHSQSLIKSRGFHSEMKIDNSYVPLIDGSNIHQYFIDNNPNEWLKYGDHLGAPRQEKFFTHPRIIFRQIISGNPLKIIAGYTEQSLYFTQIGFSMLSKKDCNLSLLYSTAFINSKLINFYHKYKFLDIEKNTFQKILIENAKQLPILELTNSEQQSFIVLVNKILEIKKKDQKADTSELEGQIDKLVYQLYDLTPEEIAIVEGQV